MKNLLRKVKSSYAASGKPLLPLTKFLQEPMRYYFHRTPLLRHDSKFYLKPFLLHHFHDLFIHDHPVDFTIYNNQVKFRSYGSSMSVQAYYVGEVEYHLVDCLLKGLKDDFIMLDVGGHHGVYSLIFAYEMKKRGLRGVIHTFEPHPDNFALLQHNIQQNDLCDFVVMHNKGVSNFSGVQNLCFHTEDNSGNFLADKDIHTTVQEHDYLQHQVEVVRLDDLLDTVDHVDLLKLDIQGGEPNALIGAEQIISRDRPKIAVEAYAGVPSTAKIQEILAEYNYATYGVKSNGELCSVNSPEVFVSWDWVALPS